MLSHDELLAKINYEIDLELQGMDAESWHEGARALRAVVELHKPFNDKCKECGDVECWGCGEWGCSSSCDCNCHAKYPCPTIQAIEKELG